ncbi:MAG: YgiQ family radical SAM protein [Bacteroidota bacterium]
MAVPSPNEYPGWLPVSLKEVEARGWDALDVILITGDAYIDHPSFGVPLLGRLLESQGYRVGLIPQPNWRDDLRDFRKLGRPGLFFGVSAGAMDSMVNHYTAQRRRRSNDAYTPGGKAGFRPDYPSIVYTRILHELFPDVPVIIGGVEASLRRFTHYDYWQDRLKESILLESGADLLVYGMGEKAILEIASRLSLGEPVSKLRDIPQTAYVSDSTASDASDSSVPTLMMNSHEDCLKSKKTYATNFRIIEEESNRMSPARLIQPSSGRLVIVNPPYPLLSENELDSYYDLPFTRLPHPRYHSKEPIPAYEMIRHSITIHRGCFGGCSFCTISAHQGKFVQSRSEESILNEVRSVVAMEDFRGYISDLGGPSANMYRMKGKDSALCRKCRRPSCLYPKICNNLDTDHRRLTSLYLRAAEVEGVKKVFIGSGVRYDFIEQDNRLSHFAEYAEELISAHVSGRLKVAPEHTEESVLRMMRKPDFRLFHSLLALFNRINNRHGLRQQLIPYFISAHPGCRPEDMAELAVKTKQLNFKLEQVQDFTPTPMTLATEIYYTGLDPYTLKPVLTAHTPEEKQEQLQFFFWYKKEFANRIRIELRRLGRDDLIGKLLGKSAHAGTKP